MKLFFLKVLTTGLQSDKSRDMKQILKKTV